jgi:hypothetical protein
LKEPLTVLPSVAGVPDPPRPLGPAGLALWQGTWSSASAWISTTDVELLLMTAESCDERSVLRAKVMAGEADWRERNALRALDERIVASLSLLGLSPADRSRHALGEVRRGVDPWDEFKARQAARRVAQREG